MMTAVCRRRNASCLAGYNEFNTLHEKSSFMDYNENPFVFRLEIFDSRTNILKTLLLTFCLVPIRLFMMIAVFLLVSFIASIGMMGNTHRTNATVFNGFRSTIHALLLRLCRFIFLLAGFFWVRVKGRRSTEAPILVVAPHSSFCDGLAVIAMNAPSVLAKHDLKNVPFLGKIIDSTQPIYVSRDQSGGSTFEIMRRIQSDENWPQILIFPEGTCTNRNCLARFKTGAFSPGVCVQPVLIRYPNKTDTYTWTWYGPNIFKLIWLTLAQLWTNIEIEYLPVYRPSEKEKNDPRFYADNVQLLMSRHLGIPQSAVSLDDCRLLSRVQRHGLTQRSLSERDITLIARLRTECDLSLTDVQHYMQLFSQMLRPGTASVTAEHHLDGDGDGVHCETVDYKQFCNSLRVPQNLDCVYQLFTQYDLDTDGRICFTDYLTVNATRAASTLPQLEASVRHLYDLADLSHTGVVSMQSARALLQQAPLSLTQNQVYALFHTVDKCDSDLVTFDEFYAFVVSRPEYILLVLDYFKLVQNL